MYKPIENQAIKLQKHDSMIETIMQGDILFRIASAQKEFEEGRQLYQQYADSLGIDLSFQDFTNELKTIDKQYNKPKGVLLLAYKSKSAVGCIGIRELDQDTAELKRMFVRTEFRGYKIGLKLLELAIDIAKELNYKKIRLDTLPTMTQAQKLYYSSGFYEIPAYRFNPINGTIFMEKELV
jgi:ribosomal protein S18 acetylase RimI-like enzyme